MNPSSPSPPPPQAGLGTSLPARGPGEGLLPANFLRRQLLPWLAGALLFGMLLAYPLGDTIRRGLSPGLLASTIQSRQVWEMTVNSILLAAGSTLLAVLLAVPAALAAGRLDWRGRGFCGLLILAPMILPPFVGAFGLRRILSYDGSFNALLLGLGLIPEPLDWFAQGKLPGIMLLQALHALPVLYLLVGAALSNIDPNLELASANLGASPWRTFWRVTRPLLGPGLMGGAILSFVGSFTDLGTPLIFEFREVLPMEVWSSLLDPDASPRVYTVLVLVMLVSAVFFAGSVLLTGKEQATLFGAGAGQLRGRRRLGPGGTCAAWAGFGLLGFLSLLPHVAVLLTSVEDVWSHTVLPEVVTLRHYAEAFGHRITAPAIRNSIGYALAATWLSGAGGFLFAYWVTRRWNKAGAFWDGLAMVPLAVPGIVLAFAYLRAFAGWGPLDARVNPVCLLILSYTVRRFPYMARACIAGFQQVHPAMEEASANLGAPTHHTLRRIYLPLVAGGLAGGAVLTFALCMLEVSDSLILADREAFYPLTKALYKLLEYRLLDNNTQMASAVGVWAMAFLAVSLYTAGVLLRSGRGPAK